MATISVGYRDEFEVEGLDEALATQINDAIYYYGQDQHQEGYNDGYSDGENDAYVDDRYDEGYQEGLDDARAEAGE